MARGAGKCRVPLKWSELKRGYNQWRMDAIFPAKLPTSPSPPLPTAALQAELAELERFFRYCSGLRERRPAPQRQYFRDVLGIAGKQDAVAKVPTPVL